MKTTSLNLEAQQTLNRLLEQLEAHLEADVLCFNGPILAGVDAKVRFALEDIPNRRAKLAVILHTPGGIVEVAERIVQVIRHFYCGNNSEVAFYIPDVAMSAGTVFAMSGDSIWMDYYSRLGPIDPQVERDDKLVPALSYLSQYNMLIDKADRGVLTDTEFAILRGFDQAELHKFAMARDLSISLLKEWLVQYKFKNWNKRKTSGTIVTLEDKRKRAETIATTLMNHEMWGSHGRGIPMSRLTSDLNLVIDDYGTDATLSRLLRLYHSLVEDLKFQNKVDHFAHTRAYM